MSWLIGLAFGGLNWLKAIGRFIGAALGKLDGRGWAELGAAIGSLVLVIHFAVETRHWRKQDGRDVNALVVEKANAAKIAKQVVDLKARIDALSSSIATKVKEEHDAKVALIAADAAAVRLRGPGRAVCPGDPALSTGPGGHVETIASSTTAGPQVSASVRAAVPWPWLVQVIEEHDELLAEAEAWRDNDKQQRAAWPHPGSTK